MATISVTEFEPIRFLRPGSTGPGLPIDMEAAVARISYHLPGGAIRWGRHEFYFAHFCGVVQVGQHTIEILPKIPGYGRDDEGKAREILIRMLACCRRIKLISDLRGDVRLQRLRLLDVVIRSFCAELSSLVKGGMIRKYIPVSSNSSFVRGRIEIPIHLRLNTLRRERVFCTYDELAEDNLPNRVFRHTLELLLRLAGSSETKRRVTELLRYFASVSRWSFNEEDLERVVMDRTINRYAYVWEQAKVFLRGLNPDVLSGGFRSYALLFDMNVLFEEFISQQLATPARRMGYTVYTQRPQRRLLNTTVSGESHFVMKPDLTLLRDGAVVTILDTKWKILTTDAKMGISQSDLYQLYTYSGEYGAEDAILIYPANPPDIAPGIREFHFVGCGRGLWTWAVDLGLIAEGKSALSVELGEMIRVTLARESLMAPVKCLTQ